MRCTSGALSFTYLQTWKAFCADVHMNSGSAVSSTAVSVPRCSMQRAFVPSLPVSIRMHRHPGTMLLPYEVEILEKCNGRSCVLVMARGLGIENIIWYNVQLYLNQCSLAILLNFRSRELAHYRKRGGVLLHEMRGTTIRQRKSMYLGGGVFSVPSRVFVTDIMNGVVRGETVSVVMVNHVEALYEGCAEAFAVYLLREKSRDTLVKGFSDNIHSLSRDSVLLEEIIRLLKVDTLLLYPWHHSTVCKSLEKELRITDVRLAQCPVLASIQSILSEVLQSLLGGLGRVVGLVLDYKKALTPNFCTALKIHCRSRRARRLLHDIRNMKVIISMLYLPSFVTFYEHYRLLLAEQLALGENATWASLASAHTLLDIAGEIALRGAKVQQKPASADAYKEDSSLCGLGISSARATRSEHADGVHKYWREKLGPAGAKVSALFRMFEREGHKKVCVLSTFKEVSALVCRMLRETFCSGTFEDMSHREFRLADEYDFDVVVLMDPCMASLKKVEADANRIRRYVEAVSLYFEDSLEEQRCIAETKGEGEGFLQLAHIKNALSLRAQCLHADVTLRSGERVAVDSREMMSTLPFAIYRSGCDIDIITLPVGDYILDEFTCVERKSIHDLISSLSGGRIHAQLRKMTLKYKNPVLLLDFKKNERPCLSDYADRGQSVLAMFAALLLEFPEIKIIWANSDVLTVRLFRWLRSRAPESRDTCEDSSRGICSDQCLESILTCIECGDSASYQKAVLEFKSLRDLANADRERLKNVFGNADGERVYRFFNGSWLKP
eukprot:jgi/Antlo1/446/1776